MAPIQLPHLTQWSRVEDLAYPPAECILFLHTDVSVRACTSSRPFVITSKQKGVVAELLDTVAKHRFVQKYLFQVSKFILR